MSSDTPPVETAQDIQVRLKPLFGVEPKHYLAVIYGLVVLGVLFAFLVLPGLSRPGTLVTVSSTPPGASVTYAGKHWGTTPLTVFFPEGKAVLTILKPGFVPVNQDYSSGNNLLFSALLPRRDSVTVALAPSSTGSVADHYRTEVGRWALAAPFTSDYRFPPLFTSFAVDAQASGWSADQVQTFLLELRGAVADPQMYLDYGRALGLWPHSSGAPESMEAQFRLWEPLVGSGSGRLALWLLANQTKPIRDRETAEASDWFRGQIGEFQASLKVAAPGAEVVPATMKSALGSFRGVPASSFLWGASGNSFPMPTEAPFLLPVPVTVDAFWIAEKEVSQAEFATFVTANPKWAPAGRDALMATGLADADYLASWKDGKPSALFEPVAAVSWYAAQAYVDWVNTTGQVPGGKKAVLPDDFQWEAAARSKAGSSLLNQGVWEWTSSAWYLGQSLVWTKATKAETAPVFARSLKGGVQTAKASVKTDDRAGWPAAATMPTLGFRLALVSP